MSVLLFTLCFRFFNMLSLLWTSYSSPSSNLEERRALLR